MAAYGCIGLAGGILLEIPVKPKKLLQFSRLVTRHATALTVTRTTPIPITKCIMSQKYLLLTCFENLISIILYLLNFQEILEFCLFFYNNKNKKNSIQNE